MTETKRKILIVEDDEITRFAYKEGLEQAGFEVFEIGDGGEAVAAAKKVRPDLMLLDLILPEKSGFEILEEIKSDESFKEIPILILSNLGQEGDVDKCKALGAIDYLVKVDTPMTEVVAKVEHYLQ